MYTWTSYQKKRSNAGTTDRRPPPLTALRLLLFRTVEKCERPAELGARLDDVWPIRLHVMTARDDAVHHGHD
jgi:hypothetical protein